MQLQQKGKNKFKNDIDNLTDIQKEILLRFKNPYNLRVPGMIIDKFMLYNEEVRKELDLNKDEFYINLSTLYRIGFICNEQGEEDNPENHFNGKADYTYNLNLSKASDDIATSHLTNIGQYAADYIEKQQQSIINTKIKKFENQINNFYSNVLIIIGLVLSIFTVISMNINSINQLSIKSDMTSIAFIIIINASICVSIAIFLFLYNRFVLEKPTKITGTFIILVLILILMSFSLITIDRFIR